MKNKLIIAAAGSGKTTFIVNQALINTDFNILIVTFTENNEKAIRNKIVQLNGHIPKNITIKTWYSFLINHGAKPYQSVFLDCSINGLILSEGISAIGSKDDSYEHYFDNDGKIYSDKLSKFVYKCDTKSSGLVISRITKIFKYIYIDEYQDLAGYDYEIVELLLNNNNINTFIVGDPRQVTYRTNRSSKNSKKYNILSDFIMDKCGRCCEIDNYTLSKSWRNCEKICNISSNLYPNYQPCVSGCNYNVDNQGVFLIDKNDTQAYINSFSPMQLRWNRKIQVVSNTPVQNMGESKGLEYDRVLIYPTKGMINWLKNPSCVLSDESRAKFYVALTRARYSAAIVCNDQIESYNRWIP